MTFIEDLVRPDGPELYFSRDEYARRIARAGELMAAQGLDAVVVSNPSNIGYLTGYDTTMPSGYTRLILLADGTLHIHCSEVEAPSVLLSSIIPAEHIHVFEWTEAHTSADDLALVIGGRLGLDGRRIGLEMGVAENFAIGAFDTRSYVTLTQKLPGITFVDVTQLVLEVRTIKTAAEIAYMRQAGQFTWAGLQAGLAAIHEGVNQNEVIAAVYAALASAGSQATSIDPMFITGKSTGWMPHVPYDNRIIEAGDTCYFEVTGTHRRYNAPSMRSAVVGEPSDGVRRLADAITETINTLISTIKPGRTGADIAREVKSPLASVKDAWFHGGYGYSIGMGFQPSWTEAPVYIAEGGDRELEPGMTFHLAVCSFLPSQYGLGFSESILITETGCETLTPYEDFHLTVVPR